MADAQPNEPKDRHPEISAPILDLSLEAQIARAEQRVVDRDARVRGDAARIVGTLRSKRGEAVRWAAVGLGAVGVGALGYAGWRAWRGHASAGGEARSDSRRPAAAGMGLTAEIAACARAAARWALRLYSEQGMAGSLFGMARSALWPRAAHFPGAAASAAAAPSRSEFADST